MRPYTRHDMTGERSRAGSDTSPPLVVIVDWTFRVHCLRHYQLDSSRLLPTKIKERNRDNDHLTGSLLFLNFRNKLLLFASYAASNS
jgi:hypothetical protein